MQIEIRKMGCQCFIEESERILPFRLLCICILMVKCVFPRGRAYNIMAWLNARCQHLWQHEWGDYSPWNHPKFELQHLCPTPFNLTANLVEGRNKHSSIDDMKSFHDWNAVSRYWGFCMHTWQILRKTKIAKEFLRRFESSWIRAWLWNTSK